MDISHCYISIRMFVLNILSLTSEIVHLNGFKAGGEKPQCCWWQQIPKAANVGGRLLMNSYSVGRKATMFQPRWIITLKMCTQEIFHQLEWGPWRLNYVQLRGISTKFNGWLYTTVLTFKGSGNEDLTLNDVLIPCNCTWLSTRSFILNDGKSAWVHL